jgi:hypothetical protein
VRTARSAEPRRDNGAAFPAARSPTRLAPLAGALIGLLGTVGCSQASSRCPPVGFPAQSIGGTPSAKDDVHEKEPSDATLRRLLSAVKAVECGSDGLDPRASSAALSRLADALTLHAGLTAPGLLRVRWAAESLDSLSGGTAGPGNVHSADSGFETGKGQPIETVHAGLVAAQQTLMARSGSVKYQSAVTALGDLVAAMQSERDLATRCQRAISAFHAASNALSVELNGEPPFGDTEPDASARRSFTSMVAGVEPARAAVASLGNARWPHARERAAEALRLFAAMLSAADCHDLFNSKVSNLRYQALRLSQSDALSFRHSRWIKQGLVTALDSLDLLDATQRALAGPAAGGKQAEPTRTAAADPWTGAARAAVDNIASDQLFALQRAPIQDGFRATLDALVIAATSAPVCRS